MKKEQFEQFLQANEKRIYHYLLTLVANDNDANDLVQMTFISFYEHIDRVEEPTSLAYLYRIAYNKSMTFLKQKNRFVNLEPHSFDNLPDTSKPEPEPDYSALRSALRELPPRLATVIHLQYYDNLSLQGYVRPVGNQRQSGGIPSCARQKATAPKIVEGRTPWESIKDMKLELRDNTTARKP